MSFAAQGQTTDDIKKEADALFKKTQFVEATPLYLQLLNVEPRSHELNYKYGTCLIYSAQDKSDAIRFLNFSVKSTTVDPLAHFYLGKAYHLNFQFSKAITAYSKFKEVGSASDQQTYNVNANIEACNNGKQLLTNITDMIVMNKTEVKEEDFYELYKLNNIGGSILVTDQFQTKIDKKLEHRPIIYFPQNSPYIFYSSYGEKGETGLDIYVKQKLANGKWSAAVKVVGDVNTDQDENYPFLSLDGKYLYYSSKGHNSMGGYDVFRSKVIVEGSSFSKPENMDFAISSPNDDILYIVDSLGRTAYFSSARESQDGKLYVYEVRVEKIPMQLAVLKGDFLNEIDPNNKSIKVDVINFTTGAIVGTFNSTPSNGSLVLTIPKSGKYAFEMTVKGSNITHRAEVSIPYMKEFRPLKIDLFHQLNNGQEVIVLKTLFDEKFDDPTAIMADVYQRISKLDPNANKYNLDSLNNLRSADDIFVEAGLDKYSTSEDIGVILEKAVENAQNTKTSLEQSSFLAHNIAASKQAEAKEKMDVASGLIEEGLKEEDASVKKATLTKAYRMTSEAQDLNEEAEVLVDLGEKLENEIKEGDDNLVSLNSALLSVKALNQNDGQALNAFVKKNTAVLSLASKSDINTTVLENIEKEGNKKSQELNSVSEKLDDLNDRKKTIESNIQASKSKLESTKKKKEVEVIENEIQSSNSELDLINSEIVKFQGKQDRFNENDRKSIALVKAVSEVKDDKNQTEEYKKAVSNTEKLKIKYSVDDQDFSTNVESASKIFNENSITGESVDLAGLNESNVRPTEYKTLPEIEGRINDILNQLESVTDPVKKAKLEKELSDLNALKEQKLEEQVVAADVKIEKSDLVEDFNSRQSNIIGMKDIAKQKDAQAQLNNDLKNSANNLIDQKQKNGNSTEIEKSEISQLKKIINEVERDLNDYKDWKEAVSNQDNFAEFTYKDALESIDNNYESNVQSISNSTKSDDEKVIELKNLNANTLSSAKEKLQEAEATLASNPENALAAKEKRQYTRLIEELENKGAIPLVEPVAVPATVSSETVFTPEVLLPNYSKNINKIENSGINELDKEKAKLNINSELLTKVNTELQLLSKDKEPSNSKVAKKNIAELEKLSKTLNDEIATSQAIIDKKIEENPSQENSVESIFSNYTSKSYQINELNSDVEKIEAIKELNEKAVVAVEDKIKKAKIANAANPRSELQYEIEELQLLKKELETNKSKDYYGVVNLEQDENLSAIKGGTDITKIEPEYNLKMESIVQDAISEKDLERKKIELNEGALAKTNHELRRIQNGINTNPENKKQLLKRTESLTEIKSTLEEKIFNSKTIVGEDAMAFNIVVDVEDANPLYSQSVEEIKMIDDKNEKTNAVIKLNKETVELIERKITIIGEDIRKNGKDRKKVLLIQKYRQLIAEIEANPQLPAKGSVVKTDLIANNDSDDAITNDVEFPVIYKDVNISEAIPSYKKELDSILLSVNTVEQKEEAKILLYKKSIENLVFQTKELETYARIESPNKEYAVEKLQNLEEIVSVLKSEITISEKKINDLAKPQIFAGISDIMPDYETRSEKIEYESSSTIDKLQKSNELNKVLLFEIESKLQELESLQKQESSVTRSENINKLTELSEAINVEINQTNNILRLSEEDVDLTAVNENKFEPLNPDHFEDDLEVNQLNLIKKDVKLIKTYEKDIARLERKKARLQGNDAAKIQKEIDKKITKQSAIHNRLIRDLEGIVDEKLWKELSQSKESAIKIKGANMHSDEIRNAEEGILIAEAKIERAKSYRKEATVIKNQVVANKILVKAAQLEYEALQLLELSNTTLTTAAIVSELTNVDIVVVDVDKAVENRTSSDLFKLATDIERRSIAAEDRAGQLADSSLTVKKKYREAIVIEMEQIKEEAARLRNKADELRYNAIEIEKQESDVLAVLPKASNKDVPKTDQLIALKSETYGEYFQEIKIANESIAEIESIQNQIDKLREDAVRIIRNAIVINSSATMDDHQSNPEVIEILNKIDKLSEDQKALKLETVSRFQNANAILNRSTASNNVKESIVIMAQRNVEPSTEIILTQEDVDNTAIAAVIADDPINNNTEIGIENTDITSTNDPATLSEASADFIAPSKLNGQLFRITDKAVYSNENPIPVNAKQPVGLVYKVQVGAFRNPLPPQSFDKFAPISGQVLSSGVTRYMVGYFTNFSPADGAKTEIHGINGFSDAFVVAYLNGERISIKRAKELENDGVIPDAISTVNDNTETETAQNNSDNQPNQNSQENSDIDNNTVVNINKVSDEVIVKPVTEIDKAKVDYYTSVADAAPASQVEIINGLFYTVQIGVYSKPVPASELFNVSPLNSQLTKSSKIRYSTGIYTILDEAVQRKNELVDLGIVDAFVTAYFNGNRISIAESKKLLEVNGESILTVGKTISEVEGVPASRYNKENVYYRILLGKFENTVPSNVANYLFNDDNIFFETEIDADNTIYLYTQKFFDLNEVKKRLVEISELGFENLEILTYYNIQSIPFDEAQKIINNEPIESLTEYETPQGINADKIFYEAEAIYYRVNLEFTDDGDVLNVQSNLNEISQFNFEQETTEDGDLIIHSENIATFEEAKTTLNAIIESGIEGAKIVAFHKYVQISIEKALEIKGR